MQPWQTWSQEYLDTETVKMSGSNDTAHRMDNPSAGSSYLPLCCLPKTVDRWGLFIIWRSQAYEARPAHISGIEQTA